MMLIPKNSCRLLKIAQPTFDGFDQPAKKNEKIGHFHQREMTFLLAHLVFRVREFSKGHAFSFCSGIDVKLEVVDANSKCTTLKKAGQ
ncbi:hypothetical protein DM01DRAFT_1101506 [Hesseltinella vesiculosa]|uniref:Uncharacterized protein n=1 Tax=Hesseltinella vesiculosa TaxID=101127 RepID=A0A1X2GBB3_9FUNG|nr:hypothetical protein DM01DRAFT_1101506 [Hesseltinella vesiculosa]